MVNGARINNLVAEQQYYVGKLGFFRYLQWLLAHNPIWMLLFTALAITLASVLLYFMLRARARVRLKD